MTGYQCLYVVLVLHVGTFLLAEEHYIYEEDATVCHCNKVGSWDSTCNQTDGQCPCKVNVRGERCDQCEAGFTSAPSSSLLACWPCKCNTAGSRHSMCHQISGQCRCRKGKHVRGQHCDQCQDGFKFTDSFKRPCRLKSVLEERREQVLADAPPRFRRAPTNVTAKMSDTVHLHCVIRYGRHKRMKNSDLRVMWLYQSSSNVRIQQSTHRILKDSFLTNYPSEISIKNISMQDAGKYTCLASKGNWLRIRSAWLTVLKN